MTRTNSRKIADQEIGVLGYGSMSFGGIFGRTDEAESMATLDAAWEGGIRHFDTANIYGMGISEAVIGKWMKSRGHRPVLATKAGIKSGPTREIDNSAPYLRAELEASLQRLGTDHVALFYIHRRDIRIPLPELIATLRELIDEGKIGGYGLSEIAPATLRAAHALHPVTAVQNEYSLWTRLPELGLITACAELGCTFVAFSPLARGMLGERAPAAPDDGFRGVNPRFTGENFRANCAIIDGFRAFLPGPGLDGQRHRPRLAAGPGSAYPADPRHKIREPSARMAGTTRAERRRSDRNRAAFARRLRPWRPLRRRPRPGGRGLLLTDDLAAQTLARLALGHIATGTTGETFPVLRPPGPVGAPTAFARQGRATPHEPHQKQHDGHDKGSKEDHPEQLSPAKRHDNGILFTTAAPRPSGWPPRQKRPSATKRRTGPKAPPAVKNC